MTLVFENRDTVRFQIQEMARVEKIITDEGIEAELDIYNPLIPEPGQLSATLFIELTTDEPLRAWLPKLVGIERAVVLRFGRRPRSRSRARGGPRPAAHPRRHHRHGPLRALGADARPRSRRSRPGPVELAIDHPAYRERRGAGARDVVAELLGDLRA